MKKTVAGVLVLLLMLCLMGTAFASEDGGSFVLAVFTANKTVIEPTRIPYRDGQTIREALLATDYTFDGLEQGFIYGVEGNAASYTLFYDGGEHDLNADAFEATALVIGVDLQASDDTVALVERMAEYRDAKNHVQAYAAASTAYRNALDGIRRNEDTAALKTALNAAIAEYEALLNGEKYTVSLTAQQGTTTLDAPAFTLTDSYGNVTQTTGTTLNVIKGEYTFVVTDGGNNRTEGKLTVDGAEELTVTLPSGAWFGTVRLLNAEKEEYPVQYDAENHAATFAVADTAGEIGSVYLNVDMGAVPDEENTRLRSIYLGTDGLDKSTTPRSWESLNSSLTYLVTEGMEGRNFTIEAQYDDANGNTQIQSYSMHISRIPTLAGLTVSAEGTVLPVAFASGCFTYELTTVADSIDIAAQPFHEGYTLDGTGNIAVTGEKTSHTVTVTAPNGAESKYVLNITQKKPVNVTLTVPAGVSATVLNEAGAELAPVSGVYRLIPGETYTYLATKNTYYHTTAEFVAQEGLSVSVAEPDEKDGLSALALYNGKNAASRMEYSCTEAFSASKHAYTCPVSDCNSSLYLQATAEDYDVTAHYISQHRGNASLNGVSREITVTYPVSEAGYAQALNNALAKSGYTQQVTLRLSKLSGSVCYYQDYDLTFVRTLHLSALTVFAQDEEQELLDKTGAVVTFDRDVTEYTVCVNRDAEELVLNGEFPNNTNDTDICGGYTLELGGKQYTSLADVAVALDPEADTETVTLTVRHTDAKSVAQSYVILVKKTDPTSVTIATTPEDAVVFLKNSANGKRIYGENGVYALTPGVQYTYTVTCAGYVGKTGAYTAPEQDETLNLALEAAAKNTALKKLDAQWPATRADSNNNGVIAGKTPVKAEEAVLNWATKIGSGYDSNACGCPILVDGYLYTYAGTTLYKVDTMTGKVVATGKMDHGSSFAINAPTYAEGMIFVGLSDGTVQAFNAVTLESLWIYRDEKKGQPNCPITYHDGYIYTGFWVGEMNEANYVCLSITDEDPANTAEKKLATWTYTSQGGFYWAGCYVCDEYLLVGTDDGQSGYMKGKARLLSLNPKTGECIDARELPVAGDIRSSITQSDGMYYFTNKNGYFFRAEVDESGKIGTLKALKLYNYASNDETPAMSTCTPTIYHNRAYIGTSGTGQFTAYSGHNITVIDLANWEIAYTVRTQGYPQTSGILTTAYEKTSGCVYVYFFDNFTPGKLRVLEDKPGQTSASLVSVEEYTVKGATKTCETAYNLFEPYGEHAEYAICSPIVDAYGTLYFKNDSGYLMAVGSAVTQLEVTSQPTQTHYRAGEVFDGTGMKITAHYANGLTRDVTEYVTWSEEPLTAEDTDLTIELPYALYQNADGKAGVEYDQPIATISLTIDTVVYGDVNGDGKVAAVDAAMAYAIVESNLTPTEQQLLAADVNGDKKVTAADAAMIYAYVAGTLEQFPVEK